MFERDDAYEFLSKDLPDHPFLDSGLRGAISNIASRNYWRVRHLMTHAELVQEGYLCYSKCNALYAHTVTDKGHFMSLFDVAFRRRINSLSDVDTRYRDQVLDTEKIEESNVSITSPNVSCDSELISLICGAPKEIQQLVLLLSNDATDGFKQTRVSQRKVRETTNQYFCRLLGKDPNSTDMVGAIRDYFTFA